MLALGKCVLSSLCCTTNAQMLLARQGHPGSRKHDQNMELKATYFNLFLLYVHYDPLMMQQKEARRKHTCVLPKKVAFMV